MSGHGLDIQQPQVTASSSTISENEELNSIDDVGLPKTHILKIFKDSVPPQTMIQREARHALGHVTVTFINYLIATATEITSKAKKKTMTANDVLAAMDMIEMKEHVPFLQEALDQFIHEKSTGSKSMPDPSETHPSVPPIQESIEPMEGDLIENSILLEEEINIMDIDE